MKTKYPNFNHVGSSAPEPTFVPDHMIRKHWSLQLIEMYHLVICLICGYLTVSFALQYGILSGVTPAISSIIFGSASFLSITDNYHYRKIICIAHSILIAVMLGAFIFTEAELAIVTTVIIQGLLIIATVFLLQKNKSYYLWCKSIAKSSS